MFVVMISIAEFQGYDKELLLKTYAENWVQNSENYAISNKF